MKCKALVAAILCVALLAWSGVAAARLGDAKPLSRRPAPGTRAPSSEELNGTRLETLWIFDADFSTLTGDNAGWTAPDRSGTLDSPNYWHHDTIRMTGHAHLGDTTWWCGTYDTCWRQPRGYGNEWIQILERHFTESSGGTPADPLRLEYDQRYAMENDYDYGYVDIRSSATADTWQTVVTVTNPGFAGQPGNSQDWDSTNPQGPGHVIVDLAGHAGVEFDLRFRFESDQAYSSQDQWNNPPNNSCLDGAWQLDNITLYHNGSPVFTDDAESGNAGWVHDDSEASGQTGVVFWRGQFGIDFVTGRAFTCENRSVGTWMYAAVDPFTSTTVDDQFSWLMSPPIDISGAEKLVSSWDQWFDCPEPSGDYNDLLLASNDNYDCVTDPDGFVDEEPGGWFGGPMWGPWTDDWDAFAGNDWLAIVWEQAQDGDGTVPHRGGTFHNWQKVGIPSGDAGTVFEVDFWNDFHDWFEEEMVDALLDTGTILVQDDDDIVSVTMHASNDDGQTWEPYSCRRESEQSNNWYFPPPVNQMAAGEEIHFYFTAIDGVGSEAIHPDDAPDHYYEFSILPIHGSVSDQSILLVDKHQRPIPTEDRRYAGLSYQRPLSHHQSQLYYVEMLEILGYEFDVYDVDVESGSNDQSDGPDSSGYKYYDTQIWFTNDFDTYAVKQIDQVNLVAWLNQSGEGKERNLLMSGNDIGYELMEVGRETLSFYETWLATNYVEDAVGTVMVDSLPTIRDRAGGHDFMTHDDGECILRGGCPALSWYDVIEPRSGVSGTEVVADYIKQDSSSRPAGVAYTHPTLGYQTVNLGFGIEYMNDGMLPNFHFVSGIEDRVNLLDNIMDYFGRLPDVPGTGVVDGGVRNVLTSAYPNPFNPVTKIAYSVKEAGPVTIEVYNVAGRVVRTLLDTEAAAGSSGHVVWDGTSDNGERCASGVYFYRIAAPGFTSSRKMVMLK